ncbi:MAG: Ycf48-like protein [Ignavibacteria bacterium]|nr:Ycf48-like protein [Ignavibacteria bacterium]
MRNYFFACALLCIFLISSAKSVFAQGFNSVTSDGINVIAVGDNGKLYRSGNGGVIYSSFPNGIVNMNSVTHYGTELWIASDGGVISKSTFSSTGLTNYSAGVSNLNSIDFINSNTGFVCGDGGVVYKTVNGGINWNISNSGISAVKLNSIYFKDANNGTVAGDNGSIYVTNDGGSSWSAQSSGTTRNLLKVKYFGDTVIAIGEYGTLIINTGIAWVSINSRINTDIRGLTGINMGNVRICGGGGFIRNNKNASDGFTNFEQNPMLANLVDIFYSDENKGWAVSSLNGVIIYTSNGGDNWNLPQGSSISRTWESKLTASGGIGNNLCQHPFDRNTMFVVYGSTVYVSRNRGENWTNIATVSGGGSAHSFYVSPLDTNIWMCAITSSPDRVTRSTNYGATWTTVVSMNFSNYGQPLEMDQNNPSNYYFAPDGGGFYRSTDNGVTFTEISGAYPFRSPCDIIVTWDSSDVIYVGDGVTGSGQAKIFKSTNNGVNWTEMYAVVSSETPSLCNSVFNRNTVYSTEWGGSGFYKTTNYGINWSLAGSTGGSGWGSDICKEDPTTVLKGTYGSPHYLSTNSGVSFISSSISGGCGAGIIFPDKSYLLAQQCSGLFKLKVVYTDSTVSSASDVQVVSLGGTGVQLYQTPTITPSGTVKNNNGISSATFTVTRRITPGTYVSTKNVTNLAPGSMTNVDFDQWTFNSGTTYTVKDSVYMNDDSNPSNDVMSGSLTPYVGEQTIVLNQEFSGAFPPAGWSLSGGGTMYWKYDNTVTGYGTGAGSSFYDFWSAGVSTPSQYLNAPSITPTIAGDSLSYDYAYAPYTSGTDSIIIETSTNGGTTFTTLVRLYGSSSASGIYALNTTGVSSTEFIPTPAQWMTKKWGLPAGTDRIRFRAKSGFGNNFYLDNIKVYSSNFYTQVVLKLTPEGFLNGGILNLKDTIKTYLRNASSPFAVVDSSYGVIDSINLTASLVFKYAPNGTYYYQILHRNALETWSKSGGESFTKGVKSNYDFTSSQSQGYGNNLVFKSPYWCMYSGDVNQDGSIDGSDLSLIDNDATNFEFGYIVTDINGDAIVDGADLAIADNNASNFVVKSTPGALNTMSAKEIMKKRNMEFYQKRKNPDLNSTDKLK